MNIRTKNNHTWGDSINGRTSDSKPEGVGSSPARPAVAVAINIKQTDNLKADENQ